MTERSWFLSRALRIQSVLTILIGVSWIATATTGRLAGVAWLEYALRWAPVDADTVVGVGWLATGVVMGVSGWLACRVPWLENVGFYAATFWPLMASAVFIIAYFQGVAPTGWVSAISYASFTVPYLVLLGRFKPEREVTVVTGAIDIPDGGGSRTG